MIIDFHTHTFPDKSSEKIVNHLAHIGCIPPHTDGSVIGLFSSMKEADIDYSVNNVFNSGNTTNSNKVTSNTVDTTIKISYNSHIIEYKAKNVNGNNYVQARPFLTNLGYFVGYNSNKRRVMAGSVTLDVGTILENGTSYIHLRDTIVFLNKHAKKDYSIIYNMKNKLITITEE